MASTWRARRTSAMWRRTASPRPRRASEPSSGRTTSSARGELGGRPARGKGEADGRSTPRPALDPELAAVSEHEVDEDLSQPITVGEHRRQVRRELATEGHAAALGLWVDDRQHRLGDLVESRRGELQRHPAELDVGEVGQVVEEAAEALGVTEDD